MNRLCTWISVFVNWVLKHELIPFLSTRAKGESAFVFKRSDWKKRQRSEKEGDYFSKGRKKGVETFQSLENRDR